MVDTYVKFFGIKKIDIVAADQMALDYEKSIKTLKKNKRII